MAEIPINTFTEQEIMPDFLAAIIAYLRDHEILTNITTEIVHRPIGTPESLGEHKRNMITLTGLPGFGRVQGLIMNPQFELRTWGANGYEAMRLWRICHTILIPPTPNYISSFTRLHCHVYNISMFNSPITLVDPTQWESRSTIYSASVREIPAL